MAGEVQGFGMLTKAGARRLGVSHLAGAEVTWRGVDPKHRCVLEVFHEGHRIGGTLSYEGITAGLIRDDGWNDWPLGDD